MTQVVAALREVTKAYPGTLAVQDVSIEFLRGEIHALVGENGAGKSTLVRILAGLIQPDHGHVEVRGEVRHFANPRASLMEGIGVVHQSGSLIETLTANENLQLGSLYVAKKDEDLEIDHSHLVLAEDIPLGRLVKELSPRQRQLVEIYRLRMQNAQLLVLDEPTATLTQQESHLLFLDLERLAHAGYAVVVISHKLAELMAHCHKFTVLRRGRVVSQMDRADATVERLVKLFSSHDASLANAANRSRRTESGSPTDELVSFAAVTTASPDDEPLNDLNLVLRRCEILGVAGRTCSGVATILKLLRHERLPLSAGWVNWNQTKTRDFVKEAIGYVPADRMNRGLIADFTTSENLKLRRRNLLTRICGRERRDEGRQFVASLIADFDIRPPNPEKTLGTLSGGNMQKVLLARETIHTKALLIVESPTAGLDIGSAAFVAGVLRRKADDGACVVVHSNDLDELVELSDRIAVISNGRCVSELTGDQVTSESLGMALFNVALKDNVDSGPLVSRASVPCAN